MSQHTDAGPRAPRRAGQHGYDVEITRRPVYWTGAILIGTALLAFAAMWAFMRGMQKYDASHAAQPSVLQEEIDRQQAQGPPSRVCSPIRTSTCAPCAPRKTPCSATYGWSDQVDRRGAHPDRQGDGPAGGPRTRAPRPAAPRSASPAARAGREPEAHP
jgi:hypothetical protein